MNESYPSRVITLVHGTFKPNAKWIQDGSEFREELAKRVLGTVAYLPFQWSGGNSHRERLRAGDDLKSHLLQARSKYPNSKRYIVAHSHGGNIAIYATSGSAQSGVVDGLICLATPFISVRARGDRFFMAMVAFLYIALMVAVFWPSFLFADWVYEPLVALLPFKFTKDHLYFAIAIVLGMPLIFLLYLWAANLLLSLDGQAEKRQEAISIDTPGKLPPLLALRLERDEAGIWLRTLVLISSLPNYLWSAIEWLLYHIVTALVWTWGVAIALLTVAALLENFDRALADVVGGAGFVAMSIVPVAFIVAMPLLLGMWAVGQLTKGHKWGFGETLLDSLMLSTKVNDGGATVFPANTGKTKNQLVSLRHSDVYGNKTVIEHVANWINKH
jgi:hypothetical protein